MRFDPNLSKDEVLQALEEDARATWGEARLPELRASLETTASALWLIAQEELEPIDLEP
ncbi:MAG TPA: hypothetical protein VEQ11_14900 [Chloroflexota bacterium]|nr:hypothetical protein [Chloroflexota bacterium]